MASLENFAAVKVAVEICNNHQLKKEIFCVFGSDHDKNDTSDADKARKWNERVEKKAGTILEELGVKKDLREKVIGVVLIFGRRSLIWAKYHEVTLGFSRNYSFKFFNSSTYITPLGIVDCKKAAEEMLIDTGLTIKQKYKLALLYCMNQHIPALDKQMTKKEKEEFYDAENPNMIQQPDFVKFWSYYLKDEVDKLRGDTDPNLYWLRMAVKSGSKYVVEYCLEQTNLINDEGALIYAALEAVHNCLMRLYDSFLLYENLEDSEIRSEHEVSPTSWIDPWVPNHYYNEVIRFLFSKMRPDTQIAFLKEDLINHEEYYKACSKVLELFLDFPYQDYFLKTAGLMSDLLPQKSYVLIFQHFTSKIWAEKEYGERLFYDYKKLLLEFLEKIPEPEKRYIFRDLHFDRGYFSVTHNAGSNFLYHLLTQGSYTYQDKIIFEWISDNATNEEKENMISSSTGEMTCIKLIKLRRWKLTDEFVSDFCTTEEKVEKFKKELSFTKEMYNVCIDSIVNDEWDEVESFIRWSTLSDVDINKHKEKMIYSDYGQSACLKLISCVKKFTAIDKVIKWCFLTEEKAAEFRKKLLFSSQGMQKCKNLVTAHQVELANEFTKRSLSSSEEVKQYKRDVANELGRMACESLIYSFVGQVFSVDDSRTQQFNGDNWEEMEIFLTWCFSSEVEISNFKKSFTMRGGDGDRNFLVQMHLLLMLSNKWEHAEMFFCWLSLSIQEIRELKKETILSGECMFQINESVKYTFHRINLNIAGDKWEGMRLFLRWCLEDEYDVLEFKNMYDEVYGFKSYEDRGQDIPEHEKNNLNQFYLFIEEFLNDLSQQ